MNQSEIGKFIARRRKEKKLTQAQLAEKLNITDRAVSKWKEYARLVYYVGTMPNIRDYGKRAVKRGGSRYGKCGEKGG